LITGLQVIFKLFYFQAGTSGSLDFVKNTTGTQSANIFIPDSIALAAVPLPPSVWLFGSGLIG
jgi:hypothetical protein